MPPDPDRPLDDQDDSTVSTWQKVRTRVREAAHAVHPHASVLAEVAFMIATASRLATVVGSFVDGDVSHVSVFAEFALLTHALFVRIARIWRRRGRGKSK
jgi:hypothetical protein